MNDEKINVLLVKPGEKATMLQINDSLEEMQRLVGGLIEEYMPFEDDVAIICNDEGKINGLPLNRAIMSEDGRVMDVIAGPFFVAYAPIESEKFLSLPENLEAKYKDKFEKPEQFFMTDSGIKAVKYDPVTKPDRIQDER